MAAHVNTMSELDRRLRETRGAVVHTADALRQRVRSDVRKLSPKRQGRRHPGVALAAVALAGLAAGRATGFMLALLFK